MDAFLQKVKDFVSAYPLYIAIGFAAFLIGFVARSALGAERPEFRLCTGADSGNYFAAGNFLARQATSIAVSVQTSRGSMENMDRILAGECDGAYVQGDAFRVFATRNPRIVPAVERAGALYEEYVHLLCNRGAGITRITQLTQAHRVAVGPEGGGAQVTWAGFVIADQRRYGPVATDPRASLRALAAVADGTEVQCMVYVGALRSSFMVSDANAVGDRVVLVPANDSDFDNQRDQRGQRVYNLRDIPADTYTAVMPRGFLGRNAVGTATMEAIFIVSTTWIGANERQYDALLRAHTAARRDIIARINGSTR